MPARVPRSAALAGLLLLPLLGWIPAAPADAAPPDAEAIVREGLVYLAAKWKEPLAGAPPSYFVETIAQLGVDPKAWPTPEDNAFARLGASTSLNQDAAYKHNARVAHAVGTAGYDPRAVDGTDFVLLLRAGYAGSQAYVNDDAWAILALRAAGVPPDDPHVQKAAVELEANRADDGGWGYVPKAATGDPDMTGMAVAALAAAGRDVRGDARARAFLDATSDPSGGHRGASGVNVQSTVWALHAYGLMGAPIREESVRFLHDARNPDGGFGIAKGRASDAHATLEALLYLSGARHPLPGYAPGATSLPRPHALDPAPLRVDGPYTRATWRVGDQVAEGTTAVLALPSKGAHAVSLLAEGPGTRWRATGSVEALTARPVVALPVAEVDTLRRQEVSLDLSGARDPDGEVARVEVDWGDGARSQGAPGVFAHAYERPGTYAAQARAVDDEGAWSDPVFVAVRVGNRAPALAPLPASFVADRATPFALDLHATDPEGDPVRVAWTLGNASGDGPLAARLAALGTHALRVVATDAHGARAFHDATVEVVNLPPTLANLTLPARADANETFAFSVEATDADGPLPTVTWRIGGVEVAGPEGSVALPAGTHEVNVTATDADGASRSLLAAIVVAAPAPRAPDADAPPAARGEVAPRLANVSAALEDRALRVRFDATPADAEVVLRLDGLAPVVVLSGDLVPINGVDEARGVLEARAGGLATSVPVGPLRVDAPPLAPLALQDAPALAEVGKLVRFRLAPHEAPEIRFDFGDGHATEWGAALEASHAYERPGAYEARAQARDGNRLVEARHVVRVEAPAPAPTLRSPTLATPSPEPPRDEPLERTQMEGPRVGATDSESARRPAPSPPAWGAALALALGAALGTRAPWGPPTRRRRRR